MLVWCLSSADHRILPSVNDCHPYGLNDLTNVIERLHINYYSYYYWCMLYVSAHMLSQHGTALPGVKVYNCSLCNYKCIDKNRFEEHDAMHTG